MAAWTGWTGRWFETEDPALGWKRRVRYDRFLFLLVLAVMLDRYTLNPAHEVMGVASILAFGVHLDVNRGWFAKVFAGGKNSGRRGRSSGLGRIASITVNVLLMASFIASIVTGLMASQSLLAWATPEHWRMDLEYRTVHVAFSVWAWFFAAVHAGVHWKALFPKLAAGVWGTRAAAAVGLVCLALAPGAWVRREADLMLAFGSAYIPVDRREIAGFMALDIVILFVAAAMVAAVIATLYARLRKARKKAGRRHPALQQPAGIQTHTAVNESRALRPQAARAAQAL